MARPSTSIGGDLFSPHREFPQLVLRWTDLVHNIRVFHAYCEAGGAVIAPHGKTTLSSEIISVQLDGGAWGMTVASARQARLAREFGATRILVANEVVGSAEIASIVDLARDPEVTILVLVDSPAAVDIAAGAVASARLSAPLGVLVEIGAHGARGGVRDAAALEATVEAVLARPALALRGFEAYEGVLPPLVAVDRFLDSVATLIEVYRDRIHGSPPIVTAGGSVYVDRVLARLGPARLPGWLLIIRAGAYVSHDSGHYERWSPLSAASHRFVGGEPLRPALELWASVLSLPEPGLAILGVGHRESPGRLDLPRPFAARSTDGHFVPMGADTRVSAMDDHHAYVTVPADLPLRVGDHVGMGISHPCEAFERWRTIATIDDDRHVIGEIHTHF